MSVYIKTKNSLPLGANRHLQNTASSPFLNIYNMYSKNLSLSRLNVILKKTTDKLLDFQPKMLPYLAITILPSILISVCSNDYYVTSFVASNTS